MGFLVRPLSEFHSVQDTSLDLIRFNLTFEGRTRLSAAKVSLISIKPIILHYTPILFLGPTQCFIGGIDGPFFQPVIFVYSCPLFSTTKVMNHSIRNYSL